MTLIKPYHPSLVVRDTLYTFEHLEPLELTVTSFLANKDLVINVRFSNHCFTEAYSPRHGSTAEGVIEDQGGVLRIFCPIRNEQAKNLASIIREWTNPKAKVWESKTERNWVFMMEIDDPAGPYYIFFKLSRSSVEDRHLQDLNLFVESAYPKDPLREPPKVHGKMAFVTLCGKIFLNKNTKTAR